MPRKTYDKLVRDLIPDIIRGDGHACAVETLDNEAFRRALRNKLVEEAQEAADASDDDLVTELADLQEVVDALIQAYGYTHQTVAGMQQERRGQRGGFARRLRLLWTES